MEHNSDRKAFEACIVEIVQCLAGLCDTEIGIHADLNQIASLSDEEGSQILGYEVAPTPQHFQFDCDLVPIEAAYLKHKEYDQYMARVLAQQHYKHEQIENIQKRLPSILNNALQNKSIADAHVFTLCELSGSFEPALRLFKKRYGDLFVDISG